LGRTLFIRPKGLSETLNEEVQPLGLKSISIDLGYFRTAFLKDGQRAPPVSRIRDYQPLTDKVEKKFQGEDKIHIVK
jgi:hypothetical protein